MRKFLLAVLSFIFVICMGSAVACGEGEATYHLVTFRKTNGVTYVSEAISNKGFENGVCEVKEGVVLTFKVELASDASGDIAVYSNANELTADDDGVYSVAILADTEITVRGIDAVGDYNRLVIPSTAGVAVNFINTHNGEPLKNGMMVRSGTEVKFTVTKAEGFYGTPVVYANSTVLKADNDIYSFVMNEPTTIKIEGIMKNISLMFNKGDNRIDYIGKDGVHFETDKALAGEYGAEIVFDVKVSVYYDRNADFEVQANTMIISPQSDGYYHVTIEDDTTISVSGLEQDVAFTARGAGNGTAANPYKLSKPIDLYEMAMRINNEFFAGSYSNLYYELVADIDLEGEQLFVIGDGSSGYAYFGGHFNGNGHTVSNYYVTDSRIDQTEFNQLFLTNVGMFGYVMPGLDSAPVIENLVLDTFTISADASRSSVSGDYTLCVGGLAGATFGASVTGISVKNGKIVVTGGKNSGAYVGGLIGQQFSEYGSGESSNKFGSGVISCMTDVNISITSSGNSYVFATGGISGSLIVGDEHYTAYIVNCYSTGDIEGGQNAGGIVGYAYNNTAIANCYSTGEVRAVSSLADGYLESVYYANAGGIVGYAEYNTVISNSFSMGYISAQSSKGTSYCKISGTIADKDGESALHHADALLPATINLHGDVKSISPDFIFNTLGWSESEWKIENGKIVFNSVFTPSVEVTFSVNSEFGTVEKVTLNAYKSMAGWGLEEGEVSIPEYISGNGGNRSYGYFFDSALTRKVPRSFVATSNITLYIGYANYASIAGVYYLGDSVTDSIVLELNADGTCVYREGALNQTAKYSWDGEQLILYYSAIGSLSKIDVDPSLIETYFGSYYIYNGTVEDGVITIYGGAVQEIGSDGYYTGNIIYMFPDNSPLKGYKEVDGFKYGSYYYDGGTYTFFVNGTGSYEKDGSESLFTYVFANGNKLNITFADGKTAVADYNDDGFVVDIDSNPVQLFDNFKGVWEKSFTTEKVYTFDGKGGWSYSGYDGTGTGVYTIENGVLSDDAGAFSARFVDGMLVISSNGISVTYYRQGSFTGEWYFNGVTSEGSDIAVGITFDGIGISGYGNAHAVYSTGTSYALTYEYTVENGKEYVLIFHRDSVFGELTYNSSELTLTGRINGHSARFTLYDSLFGKWLSDDSTITSLEFNGNGYYNLSGDRVTGALSVRGSVKVNGGRRASYSFDRDSLTGSFTYNSVEYTFVYSEDTCKVAVSSADGQFTLVLPDSWYGRELKDGSGKIYTFDGKSNLPSGGRISVSDGTSYSYILDGEDVVLNESNATISLGSDGNGKAVYVLNLAGVNVYLTLHTPFTGEWIIGGLGGTLTIGDIYADSTASASYKLYKQAEKTLNLTYNPEGNYLAYEDDGTVYTITATEVGQSYQLSFDGHKCIPKGLEDRLQGKSFSILNELLGTPNGQTLVFDGLGEYKYANGSAVVVNADGSIEKTLIYRKNTYGDWEVVSAFYEYVLRPCEQNTEFDEIVLYRLRDDSGNYYAIVSPDGLYGYKVKDASDADAYFLFNGCGEVKRVSSSGETKIYSYEIVKLDETTYKHALKFTDASGSYTVTLDLSSNNANNWNITFN